MRTTSRVCFGLAVLGALGACVFLFASGHLTFPVEPRPDGAPANAVMGSRLASWVPSMVPLTTDDGSGVPPLQRAAAARHLSHDGRHALLVGELPVIHNDGYHGIYYGEPIYVLLRAAPGRLLEAWAAPHSPKGDPLPAQPTLQELIGDGMVVHQGVMPWTWTRVHVLNAGGYVLVNKRLLGFDEGGAVVRYDRLGHFAWGRTLDTLVRNADALRSRAHGLHWSRGTTWERGTWVDEQRGWLIIVGEDNALRVLDLEDGRSITAVDEFELTAAAFRDGQPDERVHAFELACRREWAESLLSPAAALADPTQPERVRLWAATLLAQRGDHSGAALVEAVARRSMTPGAVARDDAVRAWSWLGTAMGAASIPLYIERLRLPVHQHVDTINVEMDALAALGEPAFDAAIELWLGLPEKSSLGDRYERLLNVLRSGSTEEPTPRNTGRAGDWHSLLLIADARELARLLARPTGGENPGEWSAVVLPAARWAALHPKPEFIGPLREFRAAFAADPQGRDAWRDRVLVEVDAALAACEG